MKPLHCDVGILGAGVAGLSAAAILKTAGLSVHCLEATPRIGGRILTIHDPLCPIPLELGAEFVHGRPPETFNIIRSANLKCFEHTGHAVYFLNGKPTQKGAVAETADQVMQHMANTKRRSDESFEQFLKRSHHSTQTKNWARLQVEGFNAARSDLISVGSLINESAAADKIDGDRAFRILDGYDAIPQALLRAIADHPSVIHLNSVAQTIRWQPNQVEVGYTNTLTNAAQLLRCRRLIITVPLGVLQAGSPQFDPEPTAPLTAARELQFGHVYRITLRFRDAFWQEEKSLDRAGFLISQDKRFFTWWTTHPVIAPVLTGWMAGSAADDFLPANPQVVLHEALQSLTRILKRNLPPVEAFYFHDWQADPHFRGAYSYVPFTTQGARERLAKPVRHTLYFSGEATDIHGHGSTVHGAIASGRRSAQQILKSF